MAELSHISEVLQPCILYEDLRDAPSTSLSSLSRQASPIRMLRKPCLKLESHQETIFTIVIFFSCEYFQSIMDIISELQAEMDREQQKFDDLSVRLSHINDQASAEFKDISSQLVKSQNMLALLMTRNLHCFKVVSFN